jgi:hypothetical protein
MLGPVHAYVNGGRPEPSCTVAQIGGIDVSPSQITTSFTETIGVVGNAPSTKSFNSAVTLAELRVSARKLVKQPVIPKVVRSAPPSKKAPVANIPAVPLFGV